MLKDFDVAFTNKIKAWYSNTIFAETSLVYNVAYNLVDTNPFKKALQFPLVSIYRPSGFSVQTNQNFAARKRGIPVFEDAVTHEKTMARWLVVNLPYQIDIYSKTPEDREDLTEQLLHALSLDQYLTVSQNDKESGKDYVESYDIEYDAGPVDNSTFDEGDRIYHYALTYDVKGAKIINFKGTPAIELVSVDATLDVGGSDPDDL